MKQLVLALMLMFCASPAMAISTYTVNHLGSDAGYTSFLQFVGESGSVTNVMNNRYHVNRSFQFTTTEEGSFRVSVVGPGTTFGLDSQNVMQDGNVFRVDDAHPVDSDFNDFVFSLSEQRSGPVPTPEPGTLLLFATGLAGLAWYRLKK